MSNGSLKRITPFSIGILAEELLEHFRDPHVRGFDGSFDPEEYLCQLENVTHHHQYTEGVMSRVFPTTLVQFAQKQFNTLKSNSVHSFSDFCSTFLYYFISYKKCQQPFLNLFNLNMQGLEIFLLGLSSSFAFGQQRV